VIDALAYRAGYCRISDDHAGRPELLHLLAEHGDVTARPLRCKVLYGTGIRL